MEKHYYRHLGYYNNVDDICELGQKSANEIMDYYRHGYGVFYPSAEAEEETDIIKEEEPFSDCVKFTSDFLNCVSDDTADWKGFAEYKKNNENLDWENSEENDSDFYIDIYELYKIEVNGVEFLIDE